MINFKEEIAALLNETIDGLSAGEIMDMIEIPTDSKTGDYAFPCFKLAKLLRKAPPMIAQGIAEKLQGSELFDKVENV
ncbi:MAG: arginine--tRNA ligase, partial [Eubacteriales bacterium]|nr:arginine--tRNA ligase [Eubacteriales bacterium]